MLEIESCDRTIGTIRFSFCYFGTKPKKKLLVELRTSFVLLNRVKYIFILSMKSAQLLFIKLQIYASKTFWRSYLISSLEDSRSVKKNYYCKKFKIYIFPLFKIYKGSRRFWISCRSLYYRDTQRQVRWNLTSVLRESNSVYHWSLQSNSGHK